MERPPVPVTLLTGFLGAGKTTVLRRLVRAPHGLRLAIIMNELGQAGIEPAEARQAYLELTEGCVCCVRNPDLIAALEDMWRRGDVDRVIVETTGLADPLPITWTLTRPDVARFARLDAVVTVVDAAQAASTQVEEWEAQVRAADLILLAKLDLTAGDEARALIARVNRRAGVLDARDELPLGVIFDVERAVTVPSAEPGPARHSSFAVVSIEERRRFRASVEDLLEALPPEVFRAKGILGLDDGRWLSFHWVGGRLDIAEAPAPSHGETRLVFFGRGLRRETLSALLGEHL
jgi:G3E family GTPase